MEKRSMPRFVSSAVIQTDLAEHPAVRFWQALRSERARPEAIAILKERRGKAKAKSAVYRLEGIEPDGTSVIAKRCRQATAAIERTIYEDILPHLPVSRLDYFGYVEEPDREYCWLFLEDAGGEVYLPEDREHRAIAAQWLGLMHTSAARVAAGSGLPDRGPAHYMDHLEYAQNTILQSLHNPTLTDGDLTVLRSIVSLLDVVRSYWTEVELFCRRIPRTLVHCDFVAKNVRIRSGSSEAVLLPLDWEAAGWGVPADDIQAVDIPTYWSVVRNDWTDVGLQEVGRLADFGKVFRCLASIGWDSGRLRYRWVERAMWRMRSYEPWLSDLVRTVVWRG
jgi:hypothetical protein